jgi:hypothetical protein
LSPQILTDTLALREQKEKEFVTYFRSTDYDELFFAGSYTMGDSLWDADTTGKILQAIVADKKVDSCSRFFAAQILFDNSDWMPIGEEKMEVAELYARALKDNYTGVANPWGIPDDDGDAGEHLVALGEDAVIALRPLLTCNRSLFYAGSKTATMGKLYSYRVKDIAACYINTILDLKCFLDKKKPLRRNLTIHRLRFKLFFVKGRRKKVPGL